MVTHAGVQSVEYAEPHGLGRVGQAELQPASNVVLVPLDDGLDQSARRLVLVDVAVAAVVAGLQVADVQGTQGLFDLLGLVVGI